MNRDEAKQLLPIIQAFAEGKETQFYSEILEQWEPLHNPNFSKHPNQYRIKPETIKIEHRRYLYNYSGYRIYVCESRTEAENLIINPWFVRWIDPDWITEEVEINHD